MLRPGSNGFLKDLLDTLRNQRPEFDERLFTAILLCLIAGKPNLLVRTEENDIPAVAAAAADVRLTTSLLLYESSEQTICWTRFSPPYSDFRRNASRFTSRKSRTRSHGPYSLYHLKNHRRFPVPRHAKILQLRATYQLAIPNPVPLLEIATRRLLTVETRILGHPSRQRDILAKRIYLCLQRRQWLGSALNLGMAIL